MAPTTLFDKIWSAHEVAPGLLYIDLHLVHEVTSPQAFDGLRAEGRPVRRLDLTIATEDHNTPTLDIHKPIADLTSRTQIGVPRPFTQSSSARRSSSFSTQRRGIRRAPALTG